MTSPHFLSEPAGQILFADLVQKVSAVEPTDTAENPFTAPFTTFKKKNRNNIDSTIRKFYIKGTIGITKNENNKRMPCFFT